MAEIDRTVLVQVVPEVEETADFLSLSADEGKGLVAGVVGWVDLTVAGVADELDRLRAPPAARGWSACGTWCRASPTRGG